MLQCKTCRASMEIDSECFDLCRHCGGVLINEDFTLGKISRFERINDWSRRVLEKFTQAS